MTDLDTARQAALAAEHRAVYGYGLLGPHLAAATRPLARRAQDTHAALRDQLTDVLIAAAQTPAASLASYPDMKPIRSVGAALRLATALEEACASAWRYVYAVAAESGPSTTASTRTSAQLALTDCAVRATRWRRAAGDASPTVAFPGI